MARKPAPKSPPAVGPRGAFLRTPSADKLVGVHPVTLRMWVRTGQMPQPVRVTPRCVGWYANDLHAFIESRRAGVAS